MQYGGHQKGTVSKVIARLDFFLKPKSYLLLLNCELIAATRNKMMIDS
jgi:hypothetical protein